MESFDVAVIGGGPAGMMAAGSAAESGARVVLLEKNPSLGQKLLLTGGGRCNVFNAEEDIHALTAKYGEKGKLLFSPLSKFGVEATRAFFESQGVKIKIEAEKRAFPLSDRSQDVLDALVRYMKQGDVTVKYSSRVKGLTKKMGKVSSILLEDGEISARSVILSTGGASRPETGSTGDGFRWLTMLGHTIVKPDAALVPIAMKDAWIKELSGIALSDVMLTVSQGGVKGEKKKGKMLFTHVGISGPLVLNMSKKVGEFLKKGDVWLFLDLFPSLDFGSLDRKLLGIFEREKNKRIKNGIGEITPPRLALAILRLAGIDGEKPIHQLTREERESFGRLLRNIPMQADHLLGADKAVVTSGGVALSEVDLKTMRSTKCKNLLFAGDILDFDRPSGGFSLQLCWTTGYIAGESAAI